MGRIIEDDPGSAGAPEKLRQGIVARSDPLHFVSTSDHRSARRERAPVDGGRDAAAAA
jgi:hypothetical protein